MKRKNKSLSHDQTLKTIQAEFLRFRNEVGGRYSEDLKSLTVSARKSGLTRKQVAEAAGVSLLSISKWASKLPAAKRLSVIDAAPATPRSLQNDDSSRERRIRIRLVSGVEIDLPGQELNLDLLTALNRVGH
jgi:hypothetical protein